MKGKRLLKRLEKKLKLFELAPGYDMSTNANLLIIKQKALENHIKEHKEIYKIQHFNATPVGYLYQVSFSIFVDGNLSTFESHDIANKLEKEIDEKVPEIYLTVIHVNPLDIDK